MVPDDWIFEDDGISGATLVRPALERLRDLAAQVHIDVLLCYAPDRLARKYAYQALLIEELARIGTEVRFLKGAKAETPEDELLLQFQGMIAEYERAQIAERTRRGKAHRAKEGLVNVLSHAPYGYRYIRKTQDSQARYEIVESQASVVRQVFKRYTEENLSIRALVRWLSEKGISTLSGKERWDPSVVCSMLKNPAYCGRAAFAKTMRAEGQKKVTRPKRLKGESTGWRPTQKHRPREEWIEIAVPQIVSEEIFDLAARRLQDNKRFSARHTKEATLLQGLVICRSCGYSCYRLSMPSSRSSQRKLYYYRCLGSCREFGKICGNKSIRQDYLDNLVWDHLTTLLSNPTLVLGELDRRLQELQSCDSSGVQRSRLELELSKVITARDRLVVAYQEELLSLDELRRRTPDLRKKETSLRADLQALDSRITEQETYLKLAENLDSFLVRLREAASSSSIQERQRVVRLLVKEVQIDPERVVIRHCIPLPRPEGTPVNLLRGGRPVSPTLLAASLRRDVSGTGGEPCSGDRIGGCSRAQAHRGSASRSRYDLEATSSHVAEQNKEVSISRIPCREQGCAQGALGSVRSLCGRVPRSLRGIETRRSNGAIPYRLVPARAPVRARVPGPGSVDPPVGPTRR